MPTSASFEPTRQAALQALDAVNPAAYARTRNALSGAVTRLSPYLTHGIVSLKEVYEVVNARHPLEPEHKLVYEWGWRAYYRHVWAHWGDGIERSLHEGLLPESAYSTEMPDDVQRARTGIPAIDLAVRELYETGYVHNHARMWLSSYLVHLRKVHWLAGAQWMLGHLLDGDLASNHLSWQWVAATGSSKPYLFNADNVAKYAPAAWHSPGTAIDNSYEALSDIAQSPKSVSVKPGRSDAGRGASDALQPPPCSTKPAHGNWTSARDVQADVVAGRDVVLLHPWSIGAALRTPTPDPLVIAVGFAHSHAAMPWSEKRWDFVSRGLQARTAHLWWGETAEIASALRGARSVTWQPDPHADGALQSLTASLQSGPAKPALSVQPQDDLFAPVPRYCRSFSQWWRQTSLTA